MTEFKLDKITRFQDAIKRVSPVQRAIMYYNGHKPERARDAANHIQLQHLDRFDLRQRMGTLIRLVCGCNDLDVESVAPAVITENKTGG